MCTTGTALPADFIADRRQFYAVNDLDRDGFEDLAIFGHRAADDQHVYVTFGAAGRTLDVACFDHDLAATGFFRIAGIRAEISTATAHMDHGDLFVVGLDAGDHAAVRLEQFEIDRARDFDPIPAAITSGAAAPAWTDGATAPASFVVWRYVTGGEEVLYGGGDKVFTVAMTAGRIGAFPSAVGNPTNHRIQQAIDYNQSAFIADDGTDVFRVARTMAADDLAFDTRLGGAAATGAPGGDVFAAHDVRRFENIGTFGLRVPRFATPPAVASLQLFTADTVNDRKLRGVAVPTSGGPVITDAVFINPVAGLGTALFTVLTRFDLQDHITGQQLAVQGHSGDSGDINLQQFIALDTRVIPALTSGTFADPVDHDLLLIYPRRTATDPATHSTCFRALGTACLSLCASSTCAQ